MPEPRLHVSSELFVHWCTAPTPDAVHDCPRVPYNCLGRLRAERTTPASQHLSWRFEPSTPEHLTLPWGSYSAALRDAYDYAADNPHPDPAPAQA